MAKPTPKVRAEHIIEAIGSIREYISGLDEDSFLEDSVVQSAVQFQFLIIGEAIRYFDQSILDKYRYPWHVPRSFRNYIIHEYHGIKMERIFFAAQDLKELEEQMKLILKNEF